MVVRREDLRAFRSGGAVQIVQSLLDIKPASFAGTTTLALWGVESQEEQQVADPAFHAFYAIPGKSIP
jgi:hypothetical protein